MPGPGALGLPGLRLEWALGFNTRKPFISLNPGHQAGGWGETKVDGFIIFHNSDKIRKAAYSKKGDN